MAGFDSTLIAGILGAAATAFGFRFAGLQLRQTAAEHQSNEAWRRLEFASRFVDRLSADEELAFCARALDWGVGPLLIPKRYRDLFPKGDVIIQHSWADMATAVQVSLGSNWSEPKQLTYRYCFDSFGGFLEAVQRHIKLETVEKSHLIGLRYYLDLVADSPYYRALPTKQQLVGVESRDVFRPFLQHYYPDAWALVDDRAGLPGGPTPK